MGYLRRTRAICWQAGEGPPHALVDAVSLAKHGYTNNRYRRGARGLCHCDRDSRCGPWGMYELGLSNIDGRPTPLNGDSPTDEDNLLLRRMLKTSSPISVQPLSPWSYARDLVTSGPSSSSNVGADAAWLIARHYNAGHLKNIRSLWWQLSGAASSFIAITSFTFRQLRFALTRSNGVGPRRAS